MSIARFVAAAVALMPLSLFAADAPKSEKEKPYPLATCVISGEKLGTMGKPVVIQHEGREVRLCCAHCEPDFRKDPKAAIKKLDEAAAKAAEKPKG